MATSKRMKNKGSTVSKNCEKHSLEVIWKDAVVDGDRSQPSKVN